MKIKLKKISSLLTLTLAFCGLIQQANAEKFDWIVFELKVKPKNAEGLVELLDSVFSDPNKPFKITLSESVFSDSDSTHRLAISSSEVESISEIMSDVFKNEREKFMISLHELAEVKSKSTGTRIMTTNIPEQGSDTKNSGNFNAMWEMQIKPSDAPKFLESYKTVVSATKDLRDKHVLGMGMFQFGRGKATHYVIHTFNSYSDLKKGLEAYGNHEAVAAHARNIKDIANPMGNNVVKVIKQW